LNYYFKTHLLEVLYAGKDVFLFQKVATESSFKVIIHNTFLHTASIYSIVLIP